ncbi:hypothetical protein VTN96DRAFT_4861 [Rasamsonia emersonii]
MAMLPLGACGLRSGAGASGLGYHGCTPMRSGADITVLYTLAWKTGPGEHARQLINIRQTPAPLSCFTTAAKSLVSIGESRGPPGRIDSSPAETVGAPCRRALNSLANRPIAPPNVCRKQQSAC